MHSGNQFIAINGRSILASLIPVLAIASVFSSSDTFATQSIMTANGAPACSSCHTGGAFTKAEGKTGLAAFLKAKTPTCVAPQVLNASKTACVTPPTPTPTPACDAPQVLQNNVCVTPAATACGNDDEYYVHDSEDEDSDEHESEDGHKSNEHERHSKDKHNRVVPTLSAPDKVSIHAGESLKLAVTAFDCADRPIKIQADQLPKGAKIANSIDAELHMPKAVITWQSPVSAEARTEKVVLKAVASDSENGKVASSPQSVLIEVLPTAQSQGNVLEQLVKSNTVASARFNAKSQKLELSGQVSWHKKSRKDQRQALIANEAAVITDAATGSELGTATIGKNGKWKATIATTADAAPCSIDVAFNGKTGVKSVKGVKHCRSAH